MMERFEPERAREYPPRDEYRRLRRLYFDLLDRLVVRFRLAYFFFKVTMNLS